MLPIRSREVARSQRSSVRHRKDALQPIDFSNGLLSVHLSQFNSSQFELIWVTNAKRLQAKPALFLRLYIGLFRLLCGHRCLLARGRHNVLDPHVGHEVSVVFHVMYIVEVQHA